MTKNVIGGSRASLPVPGDRLSSTARGWAPGTFGDAPRRPQLLIWSVLGVVSLVPLAIVLVASWMAWGQVREQSAQSLAGTADAAAEYTARLLDSHILLADRVDDLLRGLTDEQIRAREQEFHMVLQRMAGVRPSVLTLYAFDAQGRPLVSANLFPVPREASLRDRDFFTVLAGAAPSPVFVSSVHVGRFDGQLFFSVAERRGTALPSLDGQADSMFRGVVLASLRPDMIGAELHRFSDEPDDVVALLRADGALLARSVTFATVPAPLAQGDAVRRAMAAGSDRGIVETATDAGDSAQVTAYRLVPGWPVYVTASRSRAAIVEHWQSTITWHAAVGGSASVLMAGLVGFAFRRSREAADAREALLVSSERTRAAEAMHEHLVLLRVATEGVHLGCYDVDLPNGTLRLDRIAATVLADALPAETGVPLDGPAYARFVGLIHHEDRGPWKAALAALASGHIDKMAIEYRLRRADGSWGWVSSTARALTRDPTTGQAWRLIGVVQDVTEPHRLRADLQQGQKLQALGQLAGGIAHDFSNVLQTVSSSAELIEGAAASNDIVRTYARQLAASTTRGISIIRRLLDFARRNERQVEVLDAAHVLQGLREVLIPLMGAGITIRVEAEAGNRLLVDKGQLETALINLATNGRDAMPEGGTLTFAASQVPDGLAGNPAAVPPGLGPGGYVRVSVRDTGTGMDPATVARVAEPFFTTKPVGLGTGLGLPMVKGFAQQAGGVFTIDSNPGQGTIVTLWLPAA